MTEAASCYFLKTAFVFSISRSAELYLLTKASMPLDFMRCDGDVLKGILLRLWSVVFPALKSFFISKVVRYESLPLLSTAPGELSLFY